jgi:copper chaperone CopZ
MNKIFYTVSDIINSECKTQVKNALDKIEGVQKVGVSLKSGVVAIEYNEPADEDQIKDCIKNTGFTIT